MIYIFFWSRIIMDYIKVTLLSIGNIRFLITNKDKVVRRSCIRWSHGETISKQETISKKFLLLGYSTQV